MRRFFRPIPLAISALTLLLVYTLAGFFLVPHIIKTKVLPAVSDQLRRPVTVKDVEFNPFVLSLKMTEFEIQEQDSTPLIGFQEFFINFQTRSLFRRAYVFKEIRFSVPYVSVKIAKDGHLNLADLAPSRRARRQFDPSEKCRCVCRAAGDRNRAFRNRSRDCRVSRCVEAEDGVHRRRAD